MKFNTSAQRAQANRSNAQQSTGPRTQSGKQRSSQNALQHGLTGGSVLLPSEDPADFDRHLQGFLKEFDPHGSSEQHLIEIIAAASWRIKRIARLEAKVLLHDADTPADIYQQTRALANLSLYEQRLARQVEKASKDLRELQSGRRWRESSQLEDAAKLYEMHQEQGLPYKPEDDGFVFSNADIETFIRRRGRLEQAEEAEDDRLDGRVTRPAPPQRVSIAQNLH